MTRKTMNQEFNIQEIAIVVAVAKQNPTLVTPDFLTGSNIIPSDWEIARQPVLSQFGSQIMFKNGMSIVAQGDRLAFTERVANKSLDDLSLATVAHKYTQVMSQLDYRGVQTSLRGHLPLGRENTSAAKDFLFQQLLSPQLQQQGYKPVRAGIQLTYRINDTQLNLDINEAGLIVEKSIEPVIVFSGNFNRTIKNKESDKLAILNGFIDCWRSDWDNYTNLVNNQFISLIERPSQSATA
jgi:hypothetical protein